MALLSLPLAGAVTEDLPLPGSTAWEQVARIIPDDADQPGPRGSSSMSHAVFGFSMSIDGDLLAVGARHDESVYIFERSETGWVQQIKIGGGGALQGGFDRGFGYDVALDDGVLVVGAPFARAEGIENHGMAYVFERTPASWVLVETLVPAHPQHHGYFGKAVAVDGETVAVGMPRDGVGGATAGSVTLYTRTAGAWEPFDSWVGTPGAHLGFALALNDGLLLAGAPGADSVHLYADSPTGWTFEQVILPPAPIDGSFGFSVDVDGGTAVVGSAYSDEVAGMYAGPAANVGSAYILEQAEGGWSLATELANPHHLPGENFGYSVAVDGNLVVVGAPSAHPGFTGAAYVFQRSAGHWGTAIPLSGDDTGPNDYFGWEVEVGEGTALVGAPFDDNRRDGTPPPLDDEGDIPLLAVDEGEDAGVVYAFRRALT